MFIFTHQKVGYRLLPEVVEGLTEVDDEGVVGPEGGLDYDPVGDPPVTGHGVEIQISVQVVRGPLHLPHNVSVLPILGIRLVVGDPDILL